METNKKTIYIVTVGDYSDYHIEAVFSTKKKANEYVQQYGTECRIEEYDLDEEVVRKTNLWCCEFYTDNCKMYSSRPATFNKEEHKDTCVVNRCFGSTHELSISFYVEADTMYKAVKIARERFSAVKANDYIWLRLTRPYEINKFGMKKFERFNMKTIEFLKE